jgi:hypothetical protein
MEQEIHLQYLNAQLNIRMSDWKNFIHYRLILQSFSLPFPVA